TWSLLSCQKKLETFRRNVSTKLCGLLKMGILTRIWDEKRSHCVGVPNLSQMTLHESGRERIRIAFSVT
ncbi:MAG TPA: hypothetical protein V6D48_18055, partial [Oculatellaceae cyanobacterium]